MELFKPQICRPIRAAWLDAAYLAGAIALPDYALRRREYRRRRRRRRRKPCN
jgi:capsid protein